MPTPAGFAAVLLVLVASGCSTPGVLRPRLHVSAAPPRANADPEYRVAAGDILEVRTGSSQPIRSEVLTDGQIKLAGGSTVRVDDMTTTEIARELEDKFGRDYKSCEIAVVNYNSQFIYVFGHGREDGPRAVPYQGRESLRDLLSRVGCRSCARGYRARVVRPGQKMGESPKIVAVKLDSELYNRNRDADPVYLQANDYVYLERDGTGPGGIVPRGNKFWPLTKFQFKFWKRKQPPTEDVASVQHASRES